MSNLPNFLTYCRLGIVPLFILTFFLQWYLVAFLLFLLAGISDWVDGYLARRWDLRTRIGAILDPIADKLLMAAAVVCLAMIAVLPWWFVVVMLVKDLFVMVGIAYLRWRKVPFQYGALFWSKATTFLLVFLCGFALLDVAVPGVSLWVYPLRDFVFGGTYVLGGLMVITILVYLLKGIEILQGKPGSVP